jgi:potassium efflux system protein
LVNAATTADIAPENSAALPTIEVLKSRTEEVKAATDLGDTDKATLTELYRKAIGNLQMATEHRNKASGYAAIIEDGANETARIKAEITRAAKDGGAAPAVAGSMSLPEIEQQLQKLKADLAIAEARVAELDNQLKSEKERPTVIRQRVTEVKSQLAQLSAAPAKPSATGEAPELTEARRWANASLREQLREEGLMLEQELSSQPTRVNLLEARRDLAEINLTSLRHRVDAFEDAANRRRLTEAETVKAETLAAEQEASSKHPVVAELAARNTQLSQQIDRLANEIDGINQAEVKAADQAKRIETDFNTTRQKLEIAGLSPVLGQVLQQEKRALPDTAHFAKQTRIRETKIAETSLSQIQLEQERRQLRDLPGYVDKLASSVPPGERPDVVSELKTLATSRSELIDKVIGVQRAYLLALGELDISQRRLQDAVERYDSFLDKRLLWIRSTEPVGLDTMQRVPAQISQLLTPARWQNLFQTLFSEVLPTPLFGFALVFAIAVRIARQRLWKMLRESGVNIGNLSRDRFSDTLRAIGLLVLLALPGTMLMLVIGGELRASLEAGNFSKVVGTTLVMLAPLLFQLRAFRLFLAPESVARVHFGWRETGVQRLHRELRWFTPTLMVTAFFTTITLIDRDFGSGTGLGRTLFLALMIVFAVFFYRLAKPSGGILAALASNDPGSVMFRLRHLWFVLLVGPPFASAIVSLAGYMYTAGTLIERIMQSAWFALLVIIVHQLILRWLTLNQRKLRLEAARAKRRAEHEARMAKAQPQDVEGILERDVEEPEIDFKALDATSRKLLHNSLLLASFIGIWIIWRDVLPALQILDDFTLWTYTKSGVEDPVPITLASLGLALLVFAVTVIATRQLPAFLEIVLLQRLGMSQGSRYTVLTLTKYTVVAIGIAWTFGFLGGSWSEIQWIFAALGVGIGFGLQEIVANFISGLIILFERPIRVGDVVTVGNTDGVVTRIQIRATTIRNWDRKELLVPNKNFITQELLNWSLSDQTTRIMIRVGVAYGSDVERALLIMEEVSKEHTRVMKDPIPFCVFEEFGDNALLLSLRCYIDNIDYRLPTITELNLAINRRLADAGIEIAFPQRDIHLDTRRPLDIRLHRGQKDQG